jgi:hypothetical protein
VFVNACHGGRTDFTYWGQGGWARAFVERAGCGAFLAPFWEVEDDRARHFAEAFYGLLLQGQPLGAALRTARLEIKRTGNPTWLAYGLYGHPSADQPKPTILRHSQATREAVLAALPLAEVFEVAGHAATDWNNDPDTIARQKRIISRGLVFIDVVLKDGQVSADDLVKYCRASRPDVLANAAAAVRAQLVATHRQVMEWKKDMTAEEWGSLTVIVQGMQTPRTENAAVQYFARLFGESSGEGRRVVYADGLSDEAKALNLLGTLRLDGKLSVAVFNDPFRMYRDLLADVARPAIDDILATP